MSFLIVASPRTGSTLLVKALGCQNEIWHHTNVQGRGWSLEQSLKKPLCYFRKWNCDGAKLFYHCLNRMENAEGFLTSMNHLIFLRRKNLTEQAVSLKVAEKFGYHSTDVKKGYKISIDISELKKFADKRVMLYEKWSGKGNGISIWYEDLDANYQQTVTKINKFLDRKKGVPSPKLKKLRSPARYNKIVANYDKIVQEMGDVYGVPFGKPATLWKDL